MSSRREEKERLRQERIAAEKAAKRGEHRRLILGYVVAGLIVALVVAGIVVVALGGSGDDGEDPTSGDFPEAAHIQPLAGAVNDYAPDDREGTAPPAIAQGDLQAAAEAANCELDLDLPDEGNTHIQPDDPEPKYKTNPPTSGDHILPNFQQADGAYSEFIDPKYWVHSMEHGRVVIMYSPDLPEEDQLALKGVFDESPEGMLIFPNPDMPFEIATTAWTQMMGCDSYEGAATLDAIRDFRDTYRGFGPEQVPIFLGG